MITSTLLEYLIFYDIRSAMQHEPNLLDKAYQINVYTHSKIYPFLTKCYTNYVQCTSLHVCTFSKAAFTSTGLQLTLFHKQCICIRMVLGWQNSTHPEINTGDIRFWAARSSWICSKENTKQLTIIAYSLDSFINTWLCPSYWLVTCQNRGVKKYSYVQWVLDGWWPKPPYTLNKTWQLLYWAIYLMLFKDIWFISQTIGKIRCPYPNNKVPTLPQAFVTTQQYTT